MENKTISYYEKNANDYSDSTIDVDFNKMHERFISYLNPAAKILDYGCGSGRDAKYFLENGFSVDASDGSKKICEIASKETGLIVKHALFHELDQWNQYDGIWACASILHLPFPNLHHILNKVYIALKPNGIFYTTFKYGNFEGYMNNRYFTYMTENRLFDLLNQTYPFIVLELFITSDVRVGHESEQWLNIILKK